MKYIIQVGKDKYVKQGSGVILVELTEDKNLAEDFETKEGAEEIQFALSYLDGEYVTAELIAIPSYDKKKLTGVSFDLDSKNLEVTRRWGEKGNYELFMYTYKLTPQRLAKLMYLATELTTEVYELDYHEPGAILHLVYKE